MGDTAADNGTSGQSASVPQLNAVRVTRSEFSEIVKHATSVVRTKLTRPERKKLKLVGETSEIVAVRDWVVADVGCPIIQAGIDRSPASDAFTHHYDGAMYDLFREKFGFDSLTAENPRVVVIDG